MSETKQCSSESCKQLVPSKASTNKQHKPPIKKHTTLNQIPDEILNDKLLNEYISKLSPNYNFEIHKTVWRIRQAKAKMVALQFPEGLLMFSCAIADILEKFCNCSTLIMGDVTYGACCIDDYSAKALGCDFLVHYGHSCLIPVDVCKMNVLYVFVDIKIDVKHFIDTVKYNLKPDQKVVLVATIQFVASLRAAKSELEAYFGDVLIPQAKPLSPGEILGCTSPKVTDREVLIYLADGRFHLESIMISNPHLKAYKYDPYGKKMTIEKFDHDQMKGIRKGAIEEARKAKKWGIILGTLGRQGSPRVLKRMEEILTKSNKEYVVVLLSEIFQDKLALFSDIEAWIQIACPRLSIDWGYAFDKPLLTPYEAEVAVGTAEWQEIYPMDFYSENGGTWSVRYGEKKSKPKSKRNTELLKARLKKNKPIV